MCTTFGTTPRTLAAALAVAAALALSACGTDDPSTVASGATTTAPDNVAAAKAHSAADVTFVNDMYPHHTGAISMAELAATRAGSADVKALAVKIAQEQGPEQAQMTAMAAAWGVPAPSADMGGHDMGSSMGDDTTALEPLSGGAFDKEFLTRMTAHHESALPMARAELDSGSNPQARQLAQRIVTSQTAEIAQMKTLLASLS